MHTTTGKSKIQRYLHTHTGRTWCCFSNNTCLITPFSGACLQGGRLPASGQDSLSVDTSCLVWTEKLSVRHLRVDARIHHTPTCFNSHSLSLSSSCGAPPCETTLHHIYSHACRVTQPPLMRQWGCSSLQAATLARRASKAAQLFAATHAVQVPAAANAQRTHAANCLEVVRTPHPSPPTSS